MSKGGSSGLRALALKSAKNAGSIRSSTIGWCGRNWEGNAEKDWCSALPGRPCRGRLRTWADAVGCGQTALAGLNVQHVVQDADSY